MPYTVNKLSLVNILAVGFFWHFLSFSFLVCSFFLLGNTLNSNRVNLIAWTTFNFSIIPSFKIQDLEHYSLFQNSRFRNRNHRLIPQPPFQNFQNDHLMWYLSIETPLRQNSIRLLYLTCPELFSKSCYLWLILEDLPTSAPRKKNRAGVFFDKIVGLNH